MNGRRATLSTWSERIEVDARRRIAQAKAEGLEWAADLLRRENARYASAEAAKIEAEAVRIRGQYLERKRA